MLEKIWVLLILDWTQHPCKEYVLHLLPMGLVSIIKGDKRCCDNTKGKRLVPPLYERSSINQVAQG